MARRDVVSDRPGGRGRISGAQRDAHFDTARNQQSTRRFRYDGRIVIVVIAVDDFAVVVVDDESDANALLTWQSDVSDPMCGVERISVVHSDDFRQQRERGSWRGWRFEFKVQSDVIAIINSLVQC
jgi:hypothetical protein